MPSNSGHRPPWLSISLVSMAALAYEVLLTRLFSIIQWHHFAYMIISLALLGFGASGTFISIFRDRLFSRYKTVYLINIFLFALTSLVSFLISQSIQFNLEEIAWSPMQSVQLIAIYILLAFPFFFAATAIGLTLSCFPQAMSRIYGADLIGAGLGSLLIIVLLYQALPQTALIFIAGLGIVAAVVACYELFKTGKAIKISSLLFLVLLLILVLPGESIRLTISPYKLLSQTLNIHGTNILETRSSPLGLIHVVESPQVPFRHAPGLSLNSTASIPEQIGIFIDADAMSPITRVQDKQDLSFLDQTTTALPYHLGQIDHALILGAGAGSDVLQALSHDVKQVTAVEIDSHIVDLLQNRFQGYSGGIYKHPQVEVITAEARGFITGQDRQYDLITLSLFDSYNASSAGLYALSESYLYTVEALQSYIQHLDDEGMLVINRWLSLPPKDTLKLFNTAIASLRDMGIERPGSHLVVIRSLQTSTLVVKKTPFTPEQIRALHQFTQQFAFDLVYYWQMPVTEANRFNLLAEPYFYEGAVALLEDDAEKFIAQYKFNIEPATDDRPFFFQYFKWSSLKEIIALMEKGGMPLLEWGYLILVATLLQAMLTSLLLILMPLWFARKKTVDAPAKAINLTGFHYFLFLGLGFMFIEIAFIQKFILFLHHPTFSVAVVLASFLIFAGFGSLWSHRFIRTGLHPVAVKTAVSFIVVISLVYLATLQNVFTLLMTLSALTKTFVSIALIAPLAFFMGMPFPVGISRLGSIHAELVPWVWGVNGCASVVSAALASLLAIYFGFTWVILLAVLMYVLAFVSSLKWIGLAR